MQTNTHNAETGTAFDSRELLIMKTGIKAGYFLALSQLQDVLEKRDKSMEVRQGKAAIFKETETLARLTCTRAAINSILDQIHNHRERMIKCFDFSEGVIE